MEVDRKNLLDVISSVTPGLGTEKNLIDQSDCIVFTGKKVVTFNDSVSISANFPSEFTGAVKAQELLKFLNRVSSQAITMESDDGNLVVKSGRCRACIAMTAEVLLPFMEVPKAKKLQPIAEGLLEALSFVAFSVGTNYTRRLLTNAHVVGNTVTSSDDVRITQYDLPQEVEGEYLIPGKLIATLKAFAPEQMGGREGWAHFQKGGTTFSILMDQGEFPNCKKMMKVKGVDVKFPEGIIQSLDRAEVFLSSKFDEDNLVKVSGGKGTMKVESEGANGSFREEIDYDGPKFSLSTQPAFLKEALPKIESAIVGEDKILFKGKNFRHVATLY